MRNAFIAITLLCVAGGLLLPAMAQAQGSPEDVNIRITVKAQDAKFIGTAMGGAYVIVRNDRNGDILAEGITSGTAGDTAIIMENGYRRDAVLTDDDSAGFEFSLAVLEPLPVTITARAPLVQGSSQVEASRNMILIPGKDYSSGNGIMLELPGFAIDISAPVAGTKKDFVKGEAIPLRASVAKLCGCMIEDGTPWPADRYDVEAHIYRGSAYITTVPLVYDNAPGAFARNLKMPLPGTYRIIVTAFDPETKEGGMDSTTIILEE